MLKYKNGVSHKAIIISIIVAESAIDKITGKYYKDYVNEVDSKVLFIVDVAIDKVKNLKQNINTAENQKAEFTKKLGNGYNNAKFGPNDSISRQDLAVILYNYAVYKGIDTNNDYDIIALFVTDIINEGSYLYFSEKSKNILSKAFNVDELTEGYYLPGIISRKKQIIPNILNIIENK